MSGIKLQIVDSSENFFNAMVRLLPDTMEVNFTTDGKTAASKICAFRPDILVLAAALPGGDGFRVLQTVQSMGLHPKVLLVTPMISDYVALQVSQLKIDHIVCMPCDMGAVINHICRFRDDLAGVRDPALALIRGFLLELNFRTNLRGYRYLLEAFSLLVKNPDQSLSKELYPVVAKRYGGSWQQIERGIRLSISDAWENREGDSWMLYFPHQKEKPSNSAFLSRGISCLQEILGDES